MTAAGVRFPTYDPREHEAPAAHMIDGAGRVVPVFAARFTDFKFPTDEYCERILREYEKQQAARAAGVKYEN